jgi:uncharacterized damage-inducible protein DinB
MDHIAQNAAARARILELVRGLSDEQLRAPIGDGWTIEAELVHLAFWDRSHIARLRRAFAAGLAGPPPLPEGMADIVNDAALPGWREIPGRAALRLFEEASAEADAYIATLDDPMVQGVRDAGSARLVERFRHRCEHGDAIERARAG